MAIEQVNVMSLEDFIDEPLKIYPYKFTNERGSIAFVKEGATTIAVAENISEQPTEVDENGFVYFGAIPQMGESGELTAQNNKVFGELFENNITIQTYSANFPSTPEKDYIELGNHSLVPYFFTIGKPFDKDLYEKDEQEIFVVDSLVNIHQTDLDNDTLENEGYQEVEYINIKELLKNYDKAKIIPYVGIQPLNNPVIDDNGTSKPGFKLTQKTDMLLSRSKGITVKVETDESNLTDLDFISQDPLTTIKTSPIDYTSNQLEVYFDWFDYDVATPLNIIQEFYNPNITRTVLSNELDRKAFLDMIAISYAYITQFSSFERYTTGADTGKLIPGKYIGYVGYDIAGTATQSPDTTLANVYQKWLRDTRIDESDKRARNLKDLIAMCSKFIGGRYSIGGIDFESRTAGSNAFNEIYLPWFLKLASSIVLVQTQIPNPIVGSSGNVDTFVISDTTQTQDPNSLNFIGASRYFDADPNQKSFVPKSNMDLSEVVQIQSDRKLTLPPIDDEIQIIDKLPLPGDIDTKSSKDLKYYCVLPITNEVQFKKLYTADANITPNARVENFKLNKLPPGKTYTSQSELIDAIKTQASQASSVPKSSITIISTGTTFQEKVNASANKTVGTKPPGAPFKETKREITDAEIAASNGWNNYIVNKNNSKEVTWELTSPPIGVPSNLQRGNYIEYNYDFDLIQEQQIDIIYTIESGSIYTSTRKSKYNKSQWQKFLSDLRIFNTNEFEHTLVSERNISIKRIKEIEIGSMFGEYIKITINGVEFKVRLFQSDDEKIGRQKIIFA